MSSQIHYLASSSASTIVNPFRGKVEEVLFRHIDNENFQIEDMCRALHISRTKLYRKLKRYYGCSYTDLVCTYRMRKAAELLKTTANTISEVAYDTGFRDPSYFVKTFKKYHGVTPGRYRRLQMTVFRSHADMSVAAIY